MKGKIKGIIEIFLGVIIINIGFYFFLMPTELITGGVMGISILISDMLPFNVGFFILGINILLLVIGLITLGKAFFLKTVFGSIASPIILLILEFFFRSDLIVTRISEIHRLIISAIAGGLFVGLGLGIVIRNGATTGGMDVIQNIIHRKTKITFSIAMYLTDGIVILAGIVTYIQTSHIENIFYAIVSMAISGYLIDRVSMAGHPGYAFFIVTEKADELKRRIYEEINHGLTKISVKGGYSDDNKTMVICTVFKHQEFLFKEIVKEVDLKAFMFFMPTKEVVGLGFKRSNDREVSDVNS